MSTLTTAFTLAEKLALVNAIDSVIVADNLVHKEELKFLKNLMYLIDFDSNFILQARNLTKNQRLIILESMTEEKKREMAEILDKVAKSDGHVHEKEMSLILEICEAMGICK